MQAARELINLLRSDHDALMTVLGALSDAVPEIEGGGVSHEQERYSSEKWLAAG